MAKPQPCAAIIGGHRGRAIKPFKDAGLRFRRNPRPRIAHIEPDLIVFDLQVDRDFAARLGIFDGVACQIADHLIQPLGIAAHKNRRGGMFIGQAVVDAAGPAG